MKIADLVIGQYVERTYSMTGCVPSKKNSKLLARGRIITKPEYQQRIDALAFQIGNQGPPMTATVIDFVVRISGMDASDLDGQQTTCLDILKTRKAIVDDAPAHVTALSTHWELVPRGSESTEICVRGYETGVRLKSKRAGKVRSPRLS